MQFALTDEQRQIADLAQSLFADFAPSLRATIDGADGFDRDQWRAVMAEAALGGLAVPERFGGAGLGLIELALVMIEMGRTLWPSPFLPSIATAVPMLCHTAPEDVAARWLPGIARGDVIATVLTPPDLRIEPHGAGWRVAAQGLASFASVADLILIAGAEDLIVAPANLSGVEICRHTSLDLTRPLATVTIDVTVDADNVVRAAGPAIARALGMARVALAAESLGGAEAVLERTVDYSKQRIQFGRPIGSFQALKHRMADMMIANEAARSAVYYAAAAGDECHPEAAEASAIAHATAVEAFQSAAGHALQLHGGIGFTWEHDAHLFLRRARSAGALLGTPAQSRERLAGLIGLTVEAA